MRLEILCPKCLQAIYDNDINCPYCGDKSRAIAKTEGEANFNPYKPPPQTIITPTYIKEGLVIGIWSIILVILLIIGVIITSNFLYHKERNIFIEKQKIKRHK